MALAGPSILLNLEDGFPFVLPGAPSDNLNHQSLSSVIAKMSGNHQSPYSSMSRRKSSAKSIASSPSHSTSVPPPLRLADVAKQHCMGVHTEAWREDMLPVRQYLPMQHIIGSLKRDRDEATELAASGAPSRSRAGRRSLNSITHHHHHHDRDDVAAASPRSDDSFLQMLRTPKRRRTLDGIHTSISPTTQDLELDLNLDWHFEDRDSHPHHHASEDIPRSALPGLNHMLNLSTLTPSERDVFSESTPEDLEDSQMLMNEVLQLRNYNVMDEERNQNTDDDPGDLDDTSSTINDAFSPIVPPEREIEVRKAFEEFIDFGNSKRYIAKI